ncbi:hypothetical protein K0E99_17525 [Bacteroides fragilis]|jgi:DNA repair exonuclease SbcCD ATPase subunit|uniref:hypothetical protein n=1 Tax=Bacteroides TaxID=816 RepID=UPI0022AB150F|nr:hypothetical protein [Bacteroides fragilis]MCE8584896.1 hypothetical protein [Bacteroides fragilis]MCE8606008.1 hypothetical protein [Bacteroides fragilis]MCE8609996.1 hypothetical protein [Bacteroides fragilis]MCE8666091.1 hypothetical protein [Bacteroides fragilis]MCE8669237.1 hypothetical protein [Bacteroides fragilis]
MEQTTWWQILVLILGAVGGLEFIKWIFNRKTENRLNKLEVRQKDFDLDEKRIAELHASIDKANELNDNLLARLSNANAAIDKHIDRNRELSDRLYKAEQEVNRVNDVLTEEQHKTATLERRLGAAMRIADHYKQWRCERSDCQDPRGRRPPNPSLRGKVYTKPQNLEKEQEDTTTLNSESK